MPRLWGWGRTMDRWKLSGESFESHFGKLQSRVLSKNDSLSKLAFLALWGFVEFSSCHIPTMVLTEPDIKCTTEAE